MIGRDSRGNWVAQDQSGSRGGLFVDRADALKFARAENGNRPYEVIMVSGILELDMTSGAPQTTRAQFADDAPRQRRVA